MADEDFKERVREANPILDVTSQYLNLKKVGKRYKTLCPFHEDTKPSFYVDDVKGIFHCFGCGAGGDVFTFVQMIESVDFMEALHRLAKRANIPIPEYHKREDEVPVEEMPEVLQALERASNIFYRTLMEVDKSHPARVFLREREIPEDDFKRFGIGLTPTGWTGLMDILKDEDFDDEALLRAGLIREGERGLIDNFYKRLMFTIRRADGRVVGFGGRSLDGSEPKYINTRDTEVFHKGKMLYGLFRAREGIREKERAVVVEGYTDVLSLWIGGFVEAVAPLGTALTEDQARLLSRFTDVVHIAFDGDDAGQKAVVRSLPSLYSANCEVKVAVLKEGDDPDLVIRRDGGESFEDLISSSISGFEYLLQVYAKEYEREAPEGKAMIIEQISDVISQIRSDVRRKAITNEIAKRLKTDPSVFTLRRRPTSRTYRGAEELKLNQADIEGIKNYEVELLKLILDNSYLLQRAYEEIDSEVIISDEVSEIVEKIFELFSTGEEVTLVGVMDELGDERQKKVLSRAGMLELRWDEEKAFEDILIRIRERSLRMRLRELIEKSEEGDVSDKELADLHRELRDIKSGGDEEGGSLL